MLDKDQKKMLIDGSSQQADQYRIISSGVRVEFSEQIRQWPAVASNHTV